MQETFPYLRPLATVSVFCDTQHRGAPYADTCCHLPASTVTTPAHCSPAPALGSGTHKADVRVSHGCFLVGDSARPWPLPSSLRLLTEFISLRLYDEGLLPGPLTGTTLRC